MKTIYVAECDGKQFDDADECLAWEDLTSQLCQKWHDLLKAEDLLDVREFLEFSGCDYDTAWRYRKVVVKIAKTLMEADPGLAS